MVNYVQMAKRVDATLKRVGQAAILKRSNKSGTEYDPTAKAADEYPITIVVTNYSNWEVGQGRVLSSDKRVIMSAATGIEPQLDDFLTIGGVDHWIVGPAEGFGIIQINPAGTVVAYELHCRQ